MKFIRSLLMVVVALAVMGGASVVTLAQPPAQPLVVLNCSELRPQNPEGPAGTTCAKVKGGTTAFSIIASPSTLNPVTAEDTASLSIQDQFLGTFFASYSLLGTDAGEGNAASLIEVNEAGTVVTATLRQGLQYSDGSPVTVDDVLYWYNNVVFNENLPNSFQDAFRCTDGSPFKVTSPAPNQIQISCPEPFRTFVPFAAGQLVLSKQMALDLIAEQNVPVAGENQFGPIPAQEFMGLGAPINLLRGLGPFKMTSFASDQQASYQRNPFFYEVDSNGVQLPYLDGVQIIIIPTAGLNLALSQFLNGQTDIYGPRPEDIAVILSRAAQGGFDVNTDIDNGVPAAGETFTTPNFSDPDPDLAAAARNSKVRKALYLAIDRATMVQNVLLGIGTPQFNPVSINQSNFFSGRTNDCNTFIQAGLATAATCSGDVWSLSNGLKINVKNLPAPVNADIVQALSCLDNFAACLEQAKQLLDSVGVVDTDGNGIRNIPANLDPNGVVKNPGGKDFVVQVVTNTGNTIREAFGVIICDGWNAIGVQCSATTTSFPTLVSQLLEGTFTGYITIGLTGGDPAGAVNVVPCGTALHLYHVACDPNAPAGDPAAPTPEEQAIEAPWQQGFQATDVPGAQAGFDQFQAVWMQFVPYYHLAAGNQLFAVRTDRICNDGRAVNANTDRKFRVDLPGQAACPR